jgi:hypothetical protein
METLIYDSMYIYDPQMGIWIRTMRNQSCIIWCKNNNMTTKTTTKQETRDCMSCSTWSGFWRTFSRLWRLWKAWVWKQSDISLETVLYSVLESSQHTLVPVSKARQSGISTVICCIARVGAICYLKTDHHFDESQEMERQCTIVCQQLWHKFVLFVEMFWNFSQHKHFSQRTTFCEGK